MNLIFETEGDFLIKDGKLIAQDNSKFTVEKSGNDIIISDGFGCKTNISCGTFSQTITGGMHGNNISISNETVHINGFKIKAARGVITIEGNAEEIMYNGQNLLASSDSSKKEGDTTKEELKENEHKVLFFAERDINAITISSCGGVVIEDASVMSAENLSLSVKGSGDIFLVTGVRENINNVNASVMGSGDISLVNLKSNSYNASVMGSGDISVKQSEFNSVSLSVMGSGDITFKSSTAGSVSKSIMGSGDISGI